MKYILAFLIILSFLGPVVDKNKPTSSIIRDGIYNYITCLDSSADYLANKVPMVTKLSNLSYEKTYNKVMENRILEKHLVASGETLDDIIKNYNTNIGDLEDFRKIIYKENPDLVSADYQIRSGEYVLIPSEKLISKK
ncbi:hypothetical protein [Romboutsia sp.]|uniref:hypothetical protein n=1 Tax=Romboutsia sp. TaxID=1965302 RepID=UPI003F4146E1